MRQNLNFLLGGSFTPGEAAGKIFGGRLWRLYDCPGNAQRYVVLNSGFTYREYAYLNNARQVPKLPDWAIVDLRTPPNSLWPGRIADADFFDEQWKVKRNRSRSGEK